MALDDLKTINVEGFGDIQVPSAYGDPEIKQHIQLLKSIQQQSGWAQPALSPIQQQQMQRTVQALPKNRPIQPGNGPNMGRTSLMDAIVPNVNTRPGGPASDSDGTLFEQFADTIPNLYNSFAAKQGQKIASKLGLQQITPAQTKVNPQVSGADLGGIVRGNLTQKGREIGADVAENLAQSNPMTGMPSGVILPPEIKGVVRGVGGFAGGMAADPATYELMGMSKFGGAALQKPLSAAFAYQMGEGAVDTAGKLGQVIDNPDIPRSQKAELGTEAVLSTFMAGLAGRHAVPSAGDIPSSPSQRMPRVDPLNREMSVPRVPQTTENLGTPTSTVKISPDMFLKKVGGIEGGTETPDAKEAKITGLMEGYKRGDPIPNPSIVHDMNGNVLDADGRHRAEAARRLGIDRISVDMHQRADAPTPAGDLEPTLREDGVHDLRDMDSNARHDWINENAPFAIDGDNLAQATARAKMMYGPNFKVQPLQFIDNSGAVRYAVRHVANGEPGVVAPQAVSPSAVDRTMSDKAQDTYVRIQQLEGDFHEMTGGKHGQVLDALWNHVNDNLPSGAPFESKLGLYAKGLRELKIALVQEGGVPAMARAFDKASQRTQVGVFAPVSGMKGLTPQQVTLLNNAHVDSMLTKWEAYNDAALTSKKVLKTLQDPVFQNAVEATKDPRQASRYQDLLDKAGAARDSNPLVQLGRTLTKKTLTAGDLSRGALRENLAQAAHASVTLTKALEDYTNSWNSRPLSDTVGFIDAIEGGDIHSIPDPTDRAMAQKLRDLLDQKRQDIQGLGTGALEDFNANYFPHVWKFGVTDLARQMMSGRRPMGGGTGFLKARTYDTFSAGIADGMEPVTYNPVRMALLKLHEMERYAMAQRTFTELKTQGLVQQFSQKEIPEGWVRLNDNMFGSKTFIKPGTTSVDAPTLGQTKAWYAPSDAARPINNYLSPGLRGNALFDSVSSYNNIMNQANLGLSAFHAVETGVNAIVSQQAVGLGKIFRGDISGVKDVVTSVSAPISKALLGNRLLKEYMNPGSYSSMAGMANALDMAGGRISMPSEFKNAAVDGVRNAWKEAQAAPNGSLRQLGKAGQAVYRGLGAVMEKVSAPLMEKYIPRVKLGVFADMATDTVNRLGPNVSHEVLRHELGKVWDSVDNRFGQVVYDNLFWNRMGKDMAHLAIRSVGWNMGTIRELGGAVMDVKDTAQSGNLSNRQTYTMALLMTTAGMGYIINHLYGQKVDSPTDLLYPKTGKVGPDGAPERVFLKTYVHDSYGMMHAPAQTGVNKLAPVWHQIGDLYMNSDYFGRQIHPVHATNLDAALDPKTYTGLAKYEMQSALPFSATSVVQRHNQGESWASAIGGAAAILPAPKWVGESKAESLAYNLYKGHLSKGPNDQEAFDKLQAYHQLATGYFAGTVSEKQLDQAFDSGKLNKDQYNSIIQGDPKIQPNGTTTYVKDGTLSPLQRHVKRLGYNEFLRVFDVATPQEKLTLEDSLLSHWTTALKTTSGDVQEAINKQFEEREKQLHSGQKK